MSEEIKQLDCDDCQVKQEGNTVKLQIAEQVVSMVKNIDSRLEKHVKEQNEHNIRQADHNSRQLVAEERIAKAIEGQAIIQNTLVTVVEKMHEIEVYIARDVAIKDDVNKVHERVDTMGNDVTTNKNTNTLIRNIGCYIIAPVIVLIITFLMFGKK